jgi:Pvc16 N-terminal domain
MITPTLELIVRLLNEELDKLPIPFDVHIGNIAMLGDNNGAGNVNLRDGVILTVVNIEEERTLKNQSVYVREGAEMKKQRPAIHLNLNILFSAGDNDYLMALRRIDRILVFFQQNNVFIPTSGRVERVTVELVSLSFEQQNHLWGILGSRQLPSVLYKLRLVMIQESEQKPGPVVTEIEANGNLN